MKPETREIHDRMTAEGRTVMQVFCQWGIEPVEISGYVSHADTWQSVYYWAFKPYDVMVAEVTAAHKDYAKDND